MPTPRPPNCIPMKDLPAEALDQVALYFQALAEPSRLKILNLLRGGEASVGEIAQQCGSSVANVSRHLALLGQRGLVARETRGNSVYYRIADASIYELCDLVCGNIARQFDRALADRAAFAAAAGR